MMRDDYNVDVFNALLYIDYIMQIRAIQFFFSTLYMIINYHKPLAR